MDSSLNIILNATNSLNFLIYLQNIYLNQNHRGRHLKYPYLSTSISFKDDFDFEFKKLWNEVSQRICDDGGNDLHIFHHEKYVFYKKLFISSVDSLKMYDEVYTAFQVWWSQYAGQFAIERSVDAPMHSLYHNLANLLKESKIEPKKYLNISLIYDECLLVNNKISSNFGVLSIEHILSKHNQLSQKLKDSF
ncbi:hypothetical protein [Lysinibacillus telephonicus]|uniref:Group-specific protein n=2 Tax=Lysinibacillus telephonicus TaxID=1714840 RepID=A0A431UQZ8_9BACI|nr:hypothetical protein [Lysinibacillus telephonicus]RTQ92515.1 hypothetical protein EKG35_11955 [Lysinibacillus telephonicus]